VSGVIDPLERWRQYGEKPDTSALVADRIVREILNGVALRLRA
jgi:hypothetical protein